MNICIYGCGAIGSLLASRLAASGACVTAVARGEHLATIRDRGLQLIEADGTAAPPVHFAATDRPEELGAQDVVLLTLKSHSLSAIADDIAPLLGPRTNVVTVANGIPWWYFHGLEAVRGTPELASVDPGRRLWNAIGPERAIGCVIYPAATVIRPGVVQHTFGNRFVLGEPDGSQSDRVAALADVLQTAGFAVPIQTDIRAEIWNKLVANAAFNPVSVITGQTLGAMIDTVATHTLLENIMTEATAVAISLGATPLRTPAELLAATRALGAHKTSMLQDLEAGREPELEQVVGAVIELAGLMGVAVPNLATVYRLAKLRFAQAAL